MTADDPGTKSPGALQGDVRLTLQTHQAQRLLRGRARRGDQAAIVGLLSFADRLRPIWQAALRDDPYADWVLIKIESALARAREVLSAVSTAIRAAESSTPLTVTQARSCDPVTLALRFASPYGFRAAALLADFDGLVCRVLTARYVGSVNTSLAHTWIERGGRSVRGVLSSAQGYRDYGIDRASVAARSPQAVAAEVALGKLPGEVLTGSCVPALRPPLIGIVSAVANGSASSPVERECCPIEPTVHAEP